MHRSLLLAICLFPAAVLGAEPAPGPESGLAAIVRACWSPEQLSGNPAERAIQRGLAADREPPPAWALQAARSAAQPLSPDRRGSIRRVEPADPQARLIALTFDLCEQANERSGYDAGVVDWLRAHQVKATFFAGGKWMRTHPERTLQLMADPLFEIGNHGWTHGNLRWIQGEEARQQILMTQAQYQVLRRALGERPCAAGAGPAQWEHIPAWPTLFRFPYGTCSSETLAGVADLGLAAIQWSLVTADPDRAQSAQAIARSVRAGVKANRGAILVAHANGRGWHTAEALPLFVPQLQAEGYRFVTLSELLDAGRPVAVDQCYEVRPGDNLRYDKQFGRGTGR
jgi:peptidoglycan/xylan/chitin deacetylase (PgdA/CDA1 family)